MSAKPTATQQQAPPIDVPHSSTVPAVIPQRQHVEPDLDAEIDARFSLPPEIPTGHEITISKHFGVATPFPPEVQKALRAFRNVPDEMIDIKPNGQIYLSWRYVAEIFDDVFGIAGWGLVPERNITEKKLMRKGTTDEYEIITFYQMYKAYALGQYIRDVSGAGTYFSNNPEQNFADAVEAAESYAINRFAKRLGIGRNLRDPIYAAEWVVKYAFEDPTVQGRNKWRKKPAAGGVPVPPRRSRTWAAELVKVFTPIVGDDPGRLADTLEKLTIKAWGVERSSRSFRDLTNVEAYDLCRRLALGELTIIESPQRASDAMKKWPQARRDAWTAAHEGEGKPECSKAGCKACQWDEWEAQAKTTAAMPPPPAKQPCDGNHGDPACDDPLRWRRDPEGEIVEEEPPSGEQAPQEEEPAEVFDPKVPWRVIDVQRDGKKLPFAVILARASDETQTFTLLCYDQKLRVPAKSAMQSRTHALVTAAERDGEWVLTAIEEVG